MFQKIALIDWDMAIQIYMPLHVQVIVLFHFNRPVYKMIQNDVRSLFSRVILLIREEERRKYNADEEKNERVREKERSFAFEDKYLIESIDYDHSDCERLVHSPPCMRIEPRHFRSNKPLNN